MNQVSQRNACYMSKLLVALNLAALVLIGGCVSTDGYREFYRPLPNATPEAIAKARLAPPTNIPQLAHLDRYDEEAQQVYARQAYVLIGVSSFSIGYDQSDKDAVKQAVKVGADLVVILDPKYEGAATASVPITTPNTTTSYTNSTATAYGPAGAATAFGNSTTTTYGTNTTYVPMTVRRYEYTALYFIKKRFLFGANFRDLTDSERLQMQTNRGAYITSVVDGSPAYKSDILPGDIVLSLNGQSANGAAGFIELINANQGRTVELAIVRSGKPLSKKVSILEPP